MPLHVDITKSLAGFTLHAAFDTDGGTLALLGASGSGKSLTLKCIAGLVSPDEGVITSGGRVLFDSAAGIDLRPQARGVGYLFQSYALFPNMTVRDNIAIAYRGASENRAAAVASLLESHGLSDKADLYPAQISGGQQQRAALARIFAYGPDTLLLDEPFSALDTFLRENMQAELKRVIARYDGDVVLVTHSRDEAYRLAGRLVILDGGSVAADGTVTDVFSHPGNVRAARITGCKNISRIRRTGARAFFAEDWGIALESEEPLSPEHTHAGIRAHDFVAVGDEWAGRANVFRADVDEIVDGSFERSVIMAPRASAPLADTCPGHPHGAAPPARLGQPYGDAPRTSPGHPHGAAPHAPAPIWWIVPRGTPIAGSHTLYAPPAAVMPLAD